MTTIAYRAGVMAADSRAYAGFNTTLGSKTKIRRLECGILIGCSSNRIGLGEAVMDWYASGRKGEPPKAGDCKFTLLVVAPDGRAFYGYDDFNLSGPITADFFAIGSGEGAALGAMHAGASARDAVAIACKVDVWSGEPIVTLKHEG